MRICIHQGRDHTAAMASYRDESSRREALRALHRVIPLGSRIFKSMDLEPGYVSGDPMAQAGWLGLKWRPAHA